MRTSPLRTPVKCLSFFPATPLATALCLLLFVALPRDARSQNAAHVTSKTTLRNPFLASSKPWCRWWWFASMIRQEDVRSDLAWLKENGFGGVEVAWVYPLNRMQKDTVNYTPRQAWLSPEWTAVVGYAKRCADSMGLGCDFTFGTLWPFGDSRVSREDATRQFGDTSWRQDIRASWEYPRKGLVVDHLNPDAFRRYASRIGGALPRLASKAGTAFFVDSWEVETRKLWTPGFDREFRALYGYDIVPAMDSIHSPACSQERYDYMKLLSSKVCGFYGAFDSVSHAAGAVSRAQCAGAPCDILSAYARVDVPESEAMLYEPSYSRIVASAAALAGRKAVTSETFTCLYGWPRDHLGEEQTADLKLVADAVFANGVNHIVWHGKPLNPRGSDSVKFYASVHIGSSGSLAPEIPAFNRYLEKVSSYMKRGESYGDVAVYLPTEDAWIAGDYPREKQLIWSWGAYEMRYVTVPEELRGYHPLWINGEFLDRARVRGGRFTAGGKTFDCLYVDVKHLDAEALSSVLSLARSGVRVCMKQSPAEPGKRKSAEYRSMLEALYALPTVSREFRTAAVHPPLVEGADLPDFWCRKDGKDLYLFFANPKCGELVFPVGYGQSFATDTLRREVVFHAGNRRIPHTLVFPPYQSLLLKIDSRGALVPIDITFVPKTPSVRARPKAAREAWELE